MSTDERERVVPDVDPARDGAAVDPPGIDDWPEFDLTYLCSQNRGRGHPQEITILPEADIEENYTEWVSADADWVLDVREVR